MLLVTTSRYVPVAVKKSALTFAEKNQSGRKSATSPQIEKKQFADKGTYLNRGKKTIEELVSYARTNGFDKIAIISSKKVDYIQVKSSGWNWE